MFKWRDDQVQRNIVNKEPQRISKVPRPFGWLTHPVRGPVDGGSVVQAAGGPGSVVLAACTADVVPAANVPTQCRARKSIRHAIPPLVFCALPKQDARIGHHRSLLLCCAMPIQRKLNPSLRLLYRMKPGIGAGPVGFIGVDQLGYNLRDYLIGQTKRAVAGSINFMPGLIGYSGSARLGSYVRYGAKPDETRETRGQTSGASEAVPGG